MDRSQSAAVGNFTEIDLDPDSFGCVPGASIDYAVMEKSDRLAVVPCKIGWRDIGSWTTLGDMIEPDSEGNRIQGEALLHNTRNCTIQSHARLIGTIGVEDLVIIDTYDAILVANKSSVQNVKQLYVELKRRGHEAHKYPRTVQRPWGAYSVLEEGRGFKIKRVEVRPGASLSLQMHYHRSEHWIVVEGVARVINGEQEKIVNTNESTYIPAGQRHRLENPGMLPLVMIEVQSGQYLGEDDIVRYDEG